MLATYQGAHIFRVHNVKETLQALKYLRHSMNTVYLGLGSNLGQRENIATALITLMPMMRLPFNMWPINMKRLLFLNINNQIT